MPSRPNEVEPKDEKFVVKDLHDFLDRVRSVPRPTRTFSNPRVGKRFTVEVHRWHVGQAKPVDTSGLDPPDGRVSECGQE